LKHFLFKIYQYLGTFNTIIVAGLNAGDLLKIQISDDGANWSDLKSFQASGLASLSFNACWMRAVYSGSGAPDICVGAANDISFVITQDLGPLVFRPGTVGVNGMTAADLPGGRVKNTAQEIADALEATKAYGRRRLEVDNRFAPPSPSGIVSGLGINAATFPLLAADYPMEDVILGSYSQSPGGSENRAIEFEDGVVFRGIQNIGSGNSDSFDLIYNGVVNDGPFRTTVERQGFEIELGGGSFYNSVAGAKPMFVYAPFGTNGGQFFGTNGRGTLNIGGTGGGPKPLSAPVIDTGGNFLRLACGAGEFYNGAFTSSVVGAPFSAIQLVAMASGADAYDWPGKADWSNPLFEAAGGVYRTGYFNRSARNGVSFFGVGSALEGNPVLLGVFNRYDTDNAVQPALAPGFVEAGGSVTVTGTGFSAALVGKTATIAGATNPDNDGSFVITAATATTITYVNDAGATEPAGAATVATPHFVITAATATTITYTNATPGGVTEAAGAATTITIPYVAQLPASVGTRAGCEAIINDTGGQAGVAGKEITVRAAVGETFQGNTETGAGESDQVISSAYGGMTVWTDGFNNWYIKQ